MPNPIVSRVQFKNFGPLPDFEWSGLKSINLIVGRNGTGKTLLLKAIYATLKSLETYRRGCEPRTLAEILSDKLYWTFQTGSLGALVSKRGDGDLAFEIEIGGESLSYRVERNSNEVVDLVSSCKPRRVDSTFFSLASVLPHYSVVRESRERDFLFGFDDPCYDLACAASYPVSQRELPGRFDECRQALREIIGGSLEFNETNQSWTFVADDGNRYSLNVAGETVCKLGAFERLLGNRYIEPGSVLFFDGFDAGLDSNASRRLRYIWRLLAKEGVQIFVAASSPFKMFQELDDVATLIL